MQMNAQTKGWNGTDSTHPAESFCLTVFFLLLFFLLFQTIRVCPISQPLSVIKTVRSLDRNDDWNQLLLTILCVCVCMAKVALVNYVWPLIMHRCNIENRTLSCNPARCVCATVYSGREREEGLLRSVYDSLQLLHRFIFCMRAHGQDENVLQEFPNEQCLHRTMHSVSKQSRRNICALCAEGFGF